MTRAEHPGFDSALYDADFFTWTQRQAAALRAMPRDASLDVEHVAEEIEDLGKRDLRAVGSYLERLIEHLIKLDACPGSRDRAHWKREATVFQRSAAAAFTPGMRQFLSDESIWEGGRKLASFFIEEVGADYAEPSRSPFTLEALLSRDFEIKVPLTTLAAARSGATDVEVETKTQDEGGFS